MKYLSKKILNLTVKVKNFGQPFSLIGKNMNNTLKLAVLSNNNISNQIEGNFYSKCVNISVDKISVHICSAIKHSQGTSKCSTTIICYISSHLPQIDMTKYACNCNVGLMCINA
ncbi:hypothetical protein T07_9241 [Trichinella nelsoni]|uniref:Uncharacterized protein n=1 Tax=Trichinella nelsoni TaxID=6336 RepID=A0A0V0SHB3_9BILA|nr:hypothetical protein T07_9241 [Trichinella nelsoni]